MLAHIKKTDKFMWKWILKAQGRNVHANISNETTKAFALSTLCSPFGIARD